MNYTGKWALVTGAGRPGRIGAYIAEHLASKGANIYVHYRSSKEDAEKVRARVEEAGKKFKIEAELVYGDLANRHDVEKIFREISPDIVINNAASFRPAKTSFDMDLGSYLEEHEKAIDENIDANLKSVKLVTEAAIYNMKKEDKHGVVIFVGDAFINRGGAYPEGLSAYTSSKAYIPSIVRHYAAAHGKDGIKFLGILNGPIEPPPSAPIETVDHMKNEINLPEGFLDPWIGGQGVAEAIDNLLMIKHANGTFIEIDGGRNWTTKKEH